MKKSFITLGPGLKTLLFGYILQVSGGLNAGEVIF